FRAWGAPHGIARISASLGVAEAGPAWRRPPPRRSIKLRPSSEPESESRLRTVASYRVRFEDAQDVLAQELADGALAPAGAQERVRQERQVRRVGELTRRDDETIPVRTEGRRVLATDANDVLEVPHDRLEAVTAQVAWEEDDADATALVGDGAQLL